MRWLLPITALAACGGSSSGTCVPWTQWADDPTHSGSVCVTGQDMARAIQTLPFDALAADEEADADGELVVHYQSPLILDEDVYMMFKSGVYTPCTMTSCPLYRWTSEVWSEKGYHFDGTKLVEVWTFTSDWKPEPDVGFQPMFQPAVSGDFIYVPGAGGTLHKLTRADGKEVKLLNPFATVDPDTYVAGGITVDHDGTVYYTALKLDHDRPYSRDATGWLVKVGTDGTIASKKFQDLAPGAPAPTDLCRSAFNVNDNPLPWPPPDDENGPVLPPTTPCQSQRPGMNAAPAVGPDGTIFLVSRAHASSRAGYVLAVKPDLTPKWAASLAKILNDGCGVNGPPIDGDDQHKGDCRIGARTGVDPATNEMPSARVIDDSSSSPVVLPDGSVLYGSYTNYNVARGHLIKLSAAGAVLGNYSFGWDVTPAVWQHDGRYSIVIKDNYYRFDSVNKVDLGPYYITQLDANLGIEWRFQSTNTMSCTRNADGTKNCVSDHPNGFEWCINAPAIDADGTVYANSEDGNVYAIGQGGTQKQTLFLSMSIGAAYTPLAFDGAGRIFTLNNGSMTIIGR
jgi:outer membrane protein assembly factor BamB